MLFTIVLFLCGFTSSAYSSNKHSEDILIVLAHPDDETWLNGSVAKLVNNGYKLHIIYVTSGDKGSDRSGRGLKDELLAKEREKEAINALNILGVWDDIEFLRYPDGNLQDKIFEISEVIEEKIKSIKPTSVITFGPGGMTGHLDHIGVGQITQLAFDRSKGPNNLYNVAINKERSHLLALAAQRHGVDNYLPVEQVNKKISIHVDVSDVTYQRKLSPTAHKTQFPQVILDAWAEFVSESKYEEFILSRSRKNKHEKFIIR